MTMKKQLFLFVLFIISTTQAAYALTPSVSLETRLEEQVAKRLAELSAIYEPPTPNLAGRFYYILAPSLVHAPVDDHVLLVTGKPDDHIVLYDDNTLRHCFSGDCRDLMITQQQPVSSVAYSPYSKIVCCWTDQGKTVQVYNLEGRDLELLSSWNVQAPVVLSAMSADGSLLAAVGDDDSLMIGMPGELLVQVTRLAQRPLAMGFSPLGSVIISVDANGRVIVRRISDNSPVDEYLLPRGPFSAATFSGELLFLTRTSDIGMVWDLPNQRQLSIEDPEDLERINSQGASFVSAHDGRRYINSAAPVPAVRKVMNAVDFLVYHSVQESAVKVLDCDGQVRYYGSNHGNPLPQIFASDWKLIDPVNGLITLTNFKSYVLYDVIFSTAGLDLVCRSLPGKGYYLWWRPASEHVGEAFLKGRLPRRTGFDSPDKLEWYYFDK